MFPLSKRWNLVAAVGYGVLFSLALRGAVQIACWLLGIALSERVAGNIFLVSSLLTGAASAFAYSALQKRAKPQPPAPPAARE